VPDDASGPTLVLVHGAGHTSLVWQQVQEHLHYPSVAVDLPGRRNRPADITMVTIGDAARSVASDLADTTTGPLVLVGHSVSGIVLPALAALLVGRVQHLVFIAGLSARHGRAVVDTVRPGQRAIASSHLIEMRERYRGHVLAADGLRTTAPTIEDTKVAVGVESLNFMNQTMWWDGVPRELERTFVRPLRDPIQSRELQARLIENCGASSIIDIDSGHTPAVDAPVELAAILDHVAGSHARSSDS
jgi:pimeloyl-ACP methyl ester carboxylesterase